MSHTELPDPDAARRLISEAVPELGPPIGKQAFALAEEVRRFLDHRQLRRYTQEAKNLIRDVMGASGTNSSHGGSWYGETWYIIGQFYPYPDPGRSDPGGIYAAFYPALRTLDNKPDLWLFRASHYELRPVVDELHKALVKLANNLKSSVPRPALLPAQHPPKFALLAEEVVAETVAEQLAELIDKGVRLHEAVRQNTLPALSWESRLNSEFEGALHPFRTTEIRQRYQKATMGFAGVEALTRRQPIRSSSRQAYREIGARVHPQVYSAYTAIAVNYLAEVLELMPDYTEASGQGKRREPVVYNTYLPNAQGVIVGEQQNFTQNNSTGIDPRAFIQLSGYVGQVSSALGMDEPDRMDLERVTQELHEEATSDAPQVSQLRQLAGQIKDRLLEAGATMAATVGIQMAEQAIGTLAQ
ncbi:hypothetical protein ACFXKC_10570 [Streptomyces sp. NPDC059340]|uniref:hypothetical protein n=1 Tax=Streptomyces sp. NPDC059340 TaxID=3346806 RepID=UPI0036BA068D